MNPKAIGEISEALVLARLIKLGHKVLLPFGNNQRYDLVIDHGAAFERVQVKTGRIRKGAVVFNTSSINGFTRQRRAYNQDVDAFCVYCPDNDKVYKIPIAVCGPRSKNLSLTKERTRAGCELATEYEI
jgi:hypothetical protein